MVSGRVSLPRDDLPGGNAGLPWTLEIITWGHRGVPKCRRHLSGLWSGGKISRGGERGAAVGPAPGVRLARLTGCLRPPGEECAHAD